MHWLMAIEPLWTLLEEAAAQCQVTVSCCALRRQCGHDTRKPQPAAFCAEWASCCVTAQGSQQGNDGSSVPLRGEIHVLMVGDPGIGKSKLLQVSIEHSC